MAGFNQFEDILFHGLGEQMSQEGVTPTVRRIDVALPRRGFRIRGTGLLLESEDQGLLTMWLQRTGILALLCGVDSIKVFPPRMTNLAEYKVNSPPLVKQNSRLLWKSRL